MNERKMFHMLPWLMLAAFFYISAVFVQQPQLQTGLWKAGHITSGAYLGFWIDSHYLGHYDRHDDAYKPRVIASAIIVGTAILGMAFGL